MTALDMCQYRALATGIMAAMSDAPESWSIEQFSMANPKGEGQGSIPALLRRVAETIERLGAVEIQDLVFHAERNENAEEWPTMTVYFNPA
jgi:hypothetical protein